MTVFSDSFYNIGKGEAFEKSQCMEHEHSVFRLFVSMLTNLGYQSADSSNQTWKLKEKTVIVCLVDDFTICRTNYSLPVSHCFDQNTLVITDGRLLKKSGFAR